MHIVTPGIYFHVQGFTMTLYADSVRYTFASFAVLATSAIMHIFFVWLFVYNLDMGW